MTTGLPAFSAASTAALAGPSEPPISSTKTSMSGEAASATGSSNHGRLEMSNGRGRERERAETPVTHRPPRAGAKSGRSDRKFQQAAADRAQARDADAPGFAFTRSLRRHGVVRRAEDLVGVGQELLHVAGRLADAVLVLDQRPCAR